MSFFSPAMRPVPALPAALPYIALMAAMMVFGLGASIAKQLFPVVGPEGASAYRVGFAALMLLAVFRPWRLKLARADLVRVGLYGAVLGLMNLCFYMALRTIPLGIAIAIEFMGPLSLSLILARRPLHFVAIGLAVAGLALLLPLRADVAALDPVGVLFGLGAGLFWALYIVFGKRTAHLPAGATVALGMTVAAIIIVPIGVQAAGAALLDARLILLGLAVAVLSSAVPYCLEMVALKKIPARNLGVLLSVEPALGALVGLVVLRERLSLEQTAAIALVIAASALTVIAGRQADKIAPPV